MKTITIENILSYWPCKNYNTAGKILALSGGKNSIHYTDIAESKIPAQDKIWILVKPHFLTRKKIIQFAVFCAEQCLDIFEQQHPDDNWPRIEIEAAKENIKKNTTETRSAARSAAESAAESAAWSAQLEYIVKLLEGKQ